MNNNCAGALGWKPEGRGTEADPKQHCGQGERQTRMEHMDKSKTGSKQSPAVKGRYPGLGRLLARRD